MSKAQAISKDNPQNTDNTAKKKINIEDVLSNIRKEFGEEIVKGAKNFLDKELQIIPVSPSIDIGLGGGILEGSLFILTGPAKAGKSLTALSFAANCQLPEYGERPVFLFAVEGRIRKRDLEGIKGLNVDKLNIISSEEGQILSGEKYLTIAERIINTIPRSVVIIDSFSALCTETEMTNEMDKQQRADGAKLLAKFFRKVANIIPVNRNILIGITHLMGNPTGYGAEFKEKGGQALAYQVDTKLRARTVKAWKSNGEEGEQIGQEVEWEVICSSLGPPGNKVTSFIRYGQGIDKEKELLHAATDMGIIKKGGSWYSFDFLDEPEKFQGLDKCREVLASNPKMIKLLQERVYNLVK